MTHVDFIGLLTKASLTDDPLVLADINEAIESGSIDFVKYIGDTLRLCDELNMTQVGIDAEIKRLEALKLQREVRANNLRKLVQWVLEQMGETQWSDDLHTVLIKRNPPKVVVDNEALVPRAFIKEKVTVVEALDKVAIKDALQHGIPVDGCRLIQDMRMEVK